MELLVVISIIAIVAGLVVGLAGMAGKTGKTKLTESTNERLVTLINSYQAKLGVYPRDNKNNPGMNSLLYELAGAIRDTNTSESAQKSGSTAQSSSAPNCSLTTDY